MILSAMRSVVLDLLNGRGVTSKATPLRRHAPHPHESLPVRPSGEN
jgi:hypothetical protein